MPDVKQQPGYEEAAMPTENKTTDIIRNSVAAKRGVKEPQKGGVNNQTF